MKLMYNDSDIELPLSESYIMRVSFESKPMYRKLTYELYDMVAGNTGNWILATESQSHSLKECYMITDPLYADINSKAVLNKLNHQLTDIANYYVADLQHINTTIQKLYVQLEDGLPFNLCYKTQVTAQDIIKIGSFTFQTERNYPIETILDYMEVVQSLLNPKVFIILNLSTIADADEIKLVYESMVNNAYTVVTFDTDIDACYNLDNERHHVIDKDFCFV